MENGVETDDEIIEMAIEIFYYSRINKILHCHTVNPFGKAGASNLLVLTH